MTTCNTCKIEKDESEFSVFRGRRHGRKCKSCRKNYNARYRLEHPDQIKGYRAKYCLDKPKQKALWKAARERNKEKRKAHRKKYYLKNKEKELRTMKAWFRANPEKTRDIRRRAWHRYRAQLKQVRVHRVNFKKIIERDGMRCHLCHKKIKDKEISFDHLVPISQGGPHAEWNLALAHKRCNSARGAGKIPAQLLLQIPEPAA